MIWDSGFILRLFLCAIGAVLLVNVVSSLARRKMTESFALIWGVMALLCVIAGMLVRPVLLNSYISAIGMILIMMAVLCVIVGAYFISLRISELMRKTQELSINVTLLYDENLRLMKQVEELTKYKDELEAIRKEQEKVAVCKKKSALSEYAAENKLDIEDPAIAEAIESLNFETLIFEVMNASRKANEETQIRNFESEVFVDKYGGLLDRV